MYVFNSTFDTYLHIRLTIHLDSHAHSADFSTELGKFLVRMYQKTLSTIADERLNILNLKYSEDRESIQFLSTQNFIYPERENLSNIIFSVAGTGKTQHLFNILSRRWGYYLVSERVPRDHLYSNSLDSSSRVGLIRHQASL